MIHLDTDQLKDSYHFRLENALEDKPQGAFLHRETGLDYARQILAEEKILNEKGLQEWIRIRREPTYGEKQYLRNRYGHLGEERLAALATALTSIVKVPERNFANSE